MLFCPLNDAANAKALHTPSDHPRRRWEDPWESERGVDDGQDARWRRVSRTLTRCDWMDE